MGASRGPVGHGRDLILQDAKGATLAKSEGPYTLPALGAVSVDLAVSIPADASGKCTVVAEADAADDKIGAAARSRRWVTVASPSK